MPFCAIDTSWVPSHMTFVYLTANSHGIHTCALQLCTMHTHKHATALGFFCLPTQHFSESALSHNSPLCTLSTQQMSQSKQIFSAMQAMPYIKEHNMIGHLLFVVHWWRYSIFSYTTILCIDYKNNIGEISKLGSGLQIPHFSINICSLLLNWPKCCTTNCSYLEG